MSLTYDGHLIIGAFNGLAVIDRAFTKTPVVYNIEPGQWITNSFSVDEDNGIYVASGDLRPARRWRPAQVGLDRRDAFGC
jgi:hypothetical protein